MKFIVYVFFMLLFFPVLGHGQLSAMMTMTNDTKTGETLDDYNYFKLRYGKDEKVVDTLFVNKNPIYCLVSSSGESYDPQTGCREFYRDFYYVEDPKKGRSTDNTRDLPDYFRIFFADPQRKKLISVHFINRINEKIYWHD